MNVFESLMARFSGVRTAPESRDILVRRPRLRPARRPAQTASRVARAHDPMRDVRNGDWLAKLGRTTEARRAYRRAADAFASSNRIAQARSACRLILSLAPEDRHALALLESFEESAGVVPSDLPDDAPSLAPAIEPRPRPRLAVAAPEHDHRRISLGLIPLAEGEELLPIGAFDPATGATTGDF